MYAGETRASKCPVTNPDGEPLFGNAHQYILLRIDNVRSGTVFIEKT